MSSLAGADMAGRILGCGDGPAGFNTEAAKEGLRLFRAIQSMHSAKPTLNLVLPRPMSQ
jgi:hypothetical protein